MTAITVTATARITSPGATSTVVLYVPVLTGCSSSRAVQATAANGTFFGSVNSVGGNCSVTVTPVFSGSMLFGFLAPDEPSIFADWSANSGTNILVSDSSLALYHADAFWVDSTSVTTAGTPQALGLTYSGGSDNNSLPIIVQEIAAAGTLAIDVSTPAEAIGTGPPTAPVATTGSFTPPVGSVLLAIIAGATSSGGPITGYTLTDSANKYLWTPLVSLYTFSSSGFPAPAIYVGTLRPPVKAHTRSPVPVFSAAL